MGTIQESGLSLGDERPFEPPTRTADLLKVYAPDAT